LPEELQDVDDPGREMQLTCRSYQAMGLRICSHCIPVSPVRAKYAFGLEAKDMRGPTDILPVSHLHLLC
jgi:hypothetical protein